MSSCLLSGRMKIGRRLITNRHGDFVRTSATKAGSAEDEAIRMSAPRLYGVAESGIRGLADWVETYATR